MKFKKSLSILFCIMMLLSITVEFNTQVKAIPEKSLPKISNAEIINNNELLVTTKTYEDMVQYQVFYVESKSISSKWNLVESPDMLNGWTSPVFGSNLMKIDLSCLNLKPSNYCFAIRVKRASEKGKYSNKYGEYDDSYPLNVTIEEPSSRVPQVLNTSINSEPRTLDVSLATDTNSNQIISEIYEGLTRMEQKSDGTNYITPAGAYRWECNEKGDVWTFYLRDNYWSDGVKVTAQHYVNSILRSLDPKTNSVYSFLLSPIKNANKFNLGIIKDRNQVGIRAIDSSRLQISLEKPLPFFLEVTYLNIMKPQRLDIINRYKDSYGTAVESIVSNGPFLLKTWVHQNNICLEKNPYYWDNDKVKLQKVNFKFIQDVNEKMNEFYIGNLDLTESIQPEWSKKLQSTDKYNLMKADASTTNFTLFNLNDKYFRNSKIRKAFILAENRTEMIKNLYNGIGEPAYGFCPPSIQISGESFRKKLNKDPIIKLMEENKNPKLLLIEGLKEIGEDADPLKMDITLLTTSISIRDTEFAEFTKKNYKDTLGVDIKIKYEEWPTAKKNMDNDLYQICKVQYVADYNDPVSFLSIWLTGARIFNNNFSNVRYDDLILEAFTTLDPNKRFEYLKKAEELLIYKEGIISPNIFKAYHFFYKKEIKNLMYNPFTKFEFKYVEMK